MTGQIRTYCRRITALALGAVAITGCGSLQREQTASSIDPCAAVQTYVSQAREDSSLGDHLGAEAALLGAVSTYDKYPDTFCPGVPSRARVVMSLALTYSNQQKFAEAEDEFDIAEELITVAEARGDANAGIERIILQTNRAQHQLNTGSANGLVGANALLFTSEGIEALEGASLVFGTVSDADRNELIDQLDAALKYVVLAYNDFLADGEAVDTAEANINRAINIFRRANARQYLHRYQLLQANILLQRDDPVSTQAALEAIDEAIDAFENREVFDGSNIIGRANLIKGRILIEQGKNDEAIEAFERGISVYEENPAPIRVELIWPYLTLQKQLAEKASSDAERLRRLDGMFRATQIVRSTITAREVTNATAAYTTDSETDPIAYAIIQEWKSARQELSELRRQAAKASLGYGIYDSTARAEQAEKERVLEEKISTLRKRIDEVAPEYNARIDKPVSISDIRERLAPGEMFVQTVFREATEPGLAAQNTIARRQAGFVMFIDKESITVRQLGNMDLFQQWIALFREDLEIYVNPADGKIHRRHFDFFLANTLFREVFGPELGARLQSGDITSVTVVPSGILKGVPFEAFVVTLPTTESGKAALKNLVLNQEDYRTVDFLGRYTDMSYVPSPRAYLNAGLAKKAPEGTPFLLAGGDAQPGFDVGRWIDHRSRVDGRELSQSCISLAQQLSDIPLLPGTAQELDAITNAIERAGRLGPVNIVRGTQFTEGTVLGTQEDSPIEYYRVLHFATHGILPQDTDCGAEPALQTTADFGIEDDRWPGLLTTTEIMQKQLNADLVVLSACNTAVQNMRRQGVSRQLQTMASATDSLNGLARAFIVSGANTVVATHWTVNDQAARKLMGEFYGEVATGEITVASSLRRAQAALRSDKDTSHPNYWAAFVVIGDGGLRL